MNKTLQETLKSFDEQIGYCTRTDCVDLNEIKSFLKEAIKDALEEVRLEENCKSVFCSSSGKGQRCPCWEKAAQEQEEKRLNYLK